MRIGTATDVVRALQLARGTRRSDGDADRPWGGIVLMIGAGCSKSAGIPLGVEIAREQVLALARAYSNEEFASDDPEAAKTWLHQNLPETFPATSTWSDLYGRIFEYHVCDYVQQGAVIRNAIARAKGLNWAHVCLGELVRHHYVHTILTTNFDGLALAGIIRSGLLPIVADGIGALTRIDGRPTHPQLVQLHGSGQAYRLRNSVSDIAALESDGAVIRSIGDLLRDSPALVVAGYAGEERGVMEVMRKATAEFGRKSIFWVQYDPNPDRLASAPRHLLENGGTLIVGQDADLFFAELMRGLNHAIPDWMRDPTGALEYGLQEVIAPSKSPLIRELDTYRDRIAALVAADRQWVLDRSDLERRLSRFREQYISGRFLEAVETIRPKIGQLDEDELEVFADAGYQAGRDQVDAGLLDESIAAWRRLIAKANEDAPPERRAKFEHQMGNALTTVGQRHNRPASIEEGIEMYRRALHVRTRDAAPFDWATTMNSLGGALESIGRREAHSEHLEEAVGVYQSVLEVFTRDKRPIEWSLAETNLGNAVQLLGQRREDAALLKKAIDAYRLALEVRTSKTLPREFANTSNNLGSALCALGELERSVEYLEEALAAFREALSIRTRETLPVRWAVTQNNIGTALRLLGEYSHDPVRIGEAIAAHQLALEVNTRDRLPVAWAETQNSLGLALSTRGVLQQKETDLVEAVTQFDQALTVRTKETLPAQWANTEYYKGCAFHAAGEIVGNRAYFADALSAYQRALTVPGSFAPQRLAEIEVRVAACQKETVKPC